MEIFLVKWKKQNVLRLQVSLIIFLQNHTVSILFNYFTFVLVGKVRLPLFEKAQKNFHLPCCANNCKDNLSFEECLSAHKFFASMSVIRSREWLRDTIVASSLDNNVVQLIFHKQHVCQQAFKQLHGISNNKYSLAKHDAERPYTLITHGNIGNKNAEQPQRSSTIRTWMDQFLQENGDVDPVSGKIHVPSYINKHDLYETFVKLQSHSGEVPSKTCFFGHIKRIYPHLRFIKHTRLGCCDFCLSYAEKRNAITDQQAKVDFQEAVKQHHTLHTDERATYVSRCNQAMNQPENYMSIIIDAPKRYLLPNIQPATKTSTSIERFPVEAIGVISHSTSQREYYFYIPVWAKNPNLIITVLFLHIVTVFSQLDKKQPPVLWLQMDNASGENKNKWVLAFLCWLVQCGWFFEIVVSFLPPGHTHVDVDQMFSTLAIWLLTHTLWFLTDLVRMLSTVYQKQGTVPQGSYLQTIFNWKGFLAPHMTTIHGMKAAHVFLIRRQPDDRVGLKMKKWHTTEDPWTGSNANPKDWIYLLSSMPSGIPDQLQPQQINSTVELADIIKIDSRMPENSKLKWNHLFAEQFTLRSRTTEIPEHLFDMSQVNRIYLLLFFILIFVSTNVQYCNRIQTQ